MAQQNGESIEALKHRLFCVSQELERTRANAEARRQVHEAKLLQLQEFLIIICRERDEARRQLLKLNHILTKYSTLNATQYHALSSDGALGFDTKLLAADPDKLKASTSTAAAAMHLISSAPVALADENPWSSFQFPE